MSEKKTHNKDVYAKNTDGSTLIDNSKLMIQAVKQGNDALVAKLLNCGVPAYVSDQFGCNSFFYAARYNHLNILKLLLNDEALVNVVTKMGRTALQIASYHGHIECVQYLLDNHANVDQVDNLGMSALHWASENGHFDAVKLLLKASANFGLVSKFGKTALTLAFKKNHFEIYTLLRERCNNMDECTEFLLNDELLNSADKGYRPFTAVFIPDKNPILQAESKPNIEQCKLAFKSNLKKDDTIQLFEQHGIKLLPVDQSTIIASALKRGQTAVLTEAGKLALKKTEPNIIRRIANMSTNSISQPPAKKQKTDDENNDNISENSAAVNTTSPTPKVDHVDVPSLNKAKIIKIDAKQLVNLTANKKLIISKLKPLNPSPVTDRVLPVENPNPSLSPNSTLSKNTIESSSTALKNIEILLRKKTTMLQHMKKQMDLSLQLARHYKIQYERKEREAALYKLQLSNVYKLLLNAGMKMKKTQS